MMKGVNDMYTYYELVIQMEKQGMNRPMDYIGEIMDLIEAKTGTWPDWDDIAPDWVVNDCLRGF